MTDWQKPSPLPEIAPYPRMEANYRNSDIATSADISALEGFCPGALLSGGGGAFVRGDFFPLPVMI